MEEQTRCRVVDKHVGCLFVHTCVHMYLSMCVICLNFPTNLFKLVKN